MSVMKPAAHDAVFDLWTHTPGMGLNTLDDSREGIAKAACVVLKANETGKAFWKKNRIQQTGQPCLPELD